MEERDEHDVVLLVRHLPSELSDDEKKDFLVHFGATEVRIMPSYGRMKHTAFASFPGRGAAVKAIQRLHQTEVLGSRLSVELAQDKDSRHFPQKLAPCPKLSDKGNSSDGEKAEKQEKAKPKFDAHEDSVFTRHGLEYPRNASLSYLYPPPTLSILTNIANTLAAHPGFYVQVLHLMNKMHLPAPFGTITATPPTAKEEPCSSSESELESDEDTSRHPQKLVEASVKRPGSRRKRESHLKRARVDFSVAPAPPLAVSGSVQSLPQVFDLVTQSGPKQIQLRLPSSVVPNPTTSSLPPSESGGEAVDSSGGFGFIQPEAKADDLETANMEEEAFDIKDFISSSELRRGRLSEREMKEIPVFKNYQRGETSCRLYVKNVARQTQEKDLHSIFGRYVDWTEEIEKNAFDIRLMKEGRMKGQAFVTLPSEVKAMQALEETNGFIMHDKPLVVQFARSAKAST